MSESLKHVLTPDPSGRHAPARLVPTPCPSRPERSTGRTGRSGTWSSGWTGELEKISGLGGGSLFDPPRHRQEEPWAPFWTCTLVFPVLSLLGSPALISPGESRDEGAQRPTRHVGPGFGPASSCADRGRGPCACSRLAGNCHVALQASGRVKRRSCRSPVEIGI